MHHESAPTTPTYAPPHVPFLMQRSFSTPWSIQTPVPGAALHPRLLSTSTEHYPLPPPGLPPGQTLVNVLPKAPPLVSQLLAIYASGGERAAGLNGAVV